ncbi:hypothetical protein PoB_002486400 [Plakobranchus ocellatus]|uniref:Uncharacterized protein n=1 Tax=Plakobranchus ocellatus TaxID=259542 RepID=A0AAV3ZVB0_9GAST|nr:hypothetical protein PoB_002486400 [Plakobranchus ocellatus]
MSDTAIRSWECRDLTQLQGNNQTCQDIKGCEGSIKQGGVGGTVACESALRSAGTLLSRVRAPPSAPRPDGGP